MKNSQNEKKREIENSSINIPQLSYNFNISTTVVKYIIEKLISLTVSQSLQNKISRQIPSFCFEEIKNSLSLALYIDFINYDKDDITHKKNLLDYISKSHKNISKLKKEKEKEKEKNLIKNKSEILRKYIFGTDLDPNISYEGSINLEVFNSPKKEKDTIKESEMNVNKKFFLRYINEEKKEEENKPIKDPNLGKLLNGLIIREKFEQDKLNNKNEVKPNNLNLYSIQNEISESREDSINLERKVSPFEIKGIDTIEKIKNTESHKIEFNPKFIEEKQVLFCDVMKEKPNNWNIIPQPKVPPIDRDAGTKINFIKNMAKFKKMKTLINQENEIDSNKKNSEHKKDFNSSIKDSYKSFNKQKSKIISNFSFKKQTEPEDNNPRRKKYAPLIEFPSEDIDPKILGLNTENLELKKLRENLEKELIEKKLEQARKLQKEREIQALEKAREEKRKELANKNVTVDIKGDIIYIKSLNVNDLANDFTKMRAKYKEIKTIQNESKTSLIQKAIVEKNPVILFELTEKEKPKKKGKKNYLGYKSSKNEDRIQTGNNKVSTWIGDRVKDPILAAGSNFEILNPECGVSLKENEKTKSGGKDFFHKYNKYSIEVFEETLNKTVSSNFYSTQKNSTFNPNVNNTGLNTNKSFKKLKTKRIKEEEGNNINKTNDKKNVYSLPDIPNENNDRLLVKAKNLKLALNNLDLITENEEKYLENKKNKSMNKKNNKFLLDFFQKKKKNYEEINKFAKTLVGNENWGDNFFPDKKPKENFKIPQKPQDIELKRELPLNLLNHLPRKRLPPINMSNRLNIDLPAGLGFTTVTNGFFGRKKNLKIFLNEENNKKENEKNKNKDINDNNPININSINDDKDNNNKDKFNYTSTSGFLAKQLDE